MPDLNVKVSLDARQIAAIKKVVDDNNAANNTKLTPQQFLAERVVEITDRYKEAYEQALLDEPDSDTSLDRKALQDAWMNPTKRDAIKAILNG